jgi:hypothetical protein
MRFIKLFIVSFFCVFSCLGLCVFLSWLSYAINNFGVLQSLLFWSALIAIIFVTLIYIVGK